MLWSNECPRSAIKQTICQRVWPVENLEWEILEICLSCIKMINDNLVVVFRYRRTNVISYCVQETPHWTRPTLWLVHLKEFMLCSIWIFNRPTFLKALSTRWYVSVQSCGVSSDGYTDSSSFAEDTRCVPHLCRYASALIFCVLLSAHHPAPIQEAILSDTCVSIKLNDFWRQRCMWWKLLWVVIQRMSWE